MHAELTAAGRDAEFRDGPVASQRVRSLRVGTQHGFGFGELLGEDRTHAGFQDARFFRRDLLQRVAEEELVIQVDWGNDRERGDDDIGRVQAATQPYFEHNGVHLLACE